MQEQTAIIKTIMPEEVLNKIKYLCRAISKVEWSGILLYSVSGSITNPSEMVITLRDIIPMHKGSQVYTEYSFNEKKRDTSGYDDKHIDYVMNKPEAMDWKIGHIHSHNTMAVYFSGTDTEELEDNSPSHNYYLSLIVNNFMEFTAKVAVHAKVEVEVPVSFEATNDEGDSYSIKDQVYTLKREVVAVYDCGLETPQEEISVDVDFAEGVRGIIEKAVIAKTKTSKPFVTKGWNPNQGNSYYKKLPKTSSKKKKSKGNPKKQAFYGVVSKAQPRTEEIEEFLIYMLRFGKPADIVVFEVETAIQELAFYWEDVDDASLPAFVVELLADIVPVIQLHFPNAKGEREYITIMEEAMEILESFEKDYPFTKFITSFLCEEIIKKEKCQ